MDLNELAQPPKLAKPPERVVSLVPSITESLFVFGFGPQIVGITDYCLFPVGQVDQVNKIGGPKNPEIDEIIALNPDLVIANQEENTIQSVKELIDHGIPVWVTFPKTVDQALDVLRGLLAIFQTDAPALQVNSLQAAVDWASRAAETQDRIRYFCPIWQGEHEGDPWWMTFNQETYANNILSLFGGENIFAQRQRRYPLAADLGKADEEKIDAKADRRYPRITLEEVIEGDPELIILPDEPYKFDNHAQDELANLLAWTEAGKNNRIILLDGSLITWHGVRIGKALQELPSIII